MKIRTMRKPPISAFVACLIILAAVCLALGGCAHVPVAQRVDSKEVKAFTVSFREFGRDVLEQYLYRRYLAPAATQTLYDGPYTIESKVPWP